jgi:Peptidase family M23
VPVRPHPVVLAALALAVAALALMVVPAPALPAVREGPARATAWRWPARGPLVGAFHLFVQRPFAAGQRRGIDLAVPPGALVRAACSGRVTYAGSVPRRGLGVSLRCGALVATHLGLGRVAVRRGARVAAGDEVGLVGPGGRLRLGARRAGRRFAYLDPLTLLHEPRRVAPPVLGRGPRSRRLPFGPRPRAVLPVVTPPPAAGVMRVPWPAYPAAALMACGLPLGGFVRRRRRARALARVEAARGVPGAPEGARSAL